MENKETVLTDEQLNQVINTLEENRNETDSLLTEIEKEHENDDNSNAPLEEGEVFYTNEGTMLEDTEELDDSYFDQFDDLDNDVTFNKIVEDTLKDTVAQNYEFDEEEALRFVGVISRVRANEKFNIYNELPQQIKDQVDKMIAEQGVSPMQIRESRQFLSKMIIDELIHDTELDALSIDLQKAMKELVPTPLEMYSETNREYIENEFPVVAEKIREEDPKKADNLLAMRQGFIDAYKLDPMHSLLDNNKIVKNLTKAEVMWSRISNDYFTFASESKFNLYPIEDVFNALIEIGYDKVQAYRITELSVYAFTNGVTNLKDETAYNDIYRNSFANYFENNIKNLGIHPDLASDFSKTVKENLDNLNEHIESAIAAREAFKRELSNKNK